MEQRAKAGAMGREVPDNSGWARTALIPLLVALVTGVTGAALALGDLPAVKAVVHHTPTAHRHKVKPSLPRVVSMRAVVQGYDMATGMVTITIGGERYRAHAPGSPSLRLACGQSQSLRAGQPVVISVIAYLSGSLSTWTLRAEPLPRPGCVASAKP